MGNVESSLQWLATCLHRAADYIVVSLTAADIASLEPAKGVIGTSTPATASAVAPSVQHASSPSKAAVLFGDLPATPTGATKVPSINFSPLCIHVHTFITIKTFNVLDLRYNINTL